jgi:hypothetical protein
MAAPTFHAIVVVDIESFGPRRNPVQASLRKNMYEVVQEAGTDAHLDWSAVTDLDRGDGVILLIPPPTSTVDLAGAFVRALDANLKEKASMFSEAHRMRFRVALHQGLCQPDGKGWVGAAITTACRLVDADPPRTALRAAADARMVLIVSDEIYQNVISHGYRLIDAASFAPATLAGGEKAWVSVPGRAYPPGLEEPATPRSERPQPRVPRQSGGIANHGSVFVQGDLVAGDKYQGDRVAGDKYQERP